MHLMIALIAYLMIALLMHLNIALITHLNIAPITHIMGRGWLALCFLALLSAAGSWLSRERESARSLEHPKGKDDDEER